MAGWEQLTPNQIIFIFELVFAGVLVYTFGRIATVYIERNTVKYIEVKVKKELGVEPKSSLFVTLKEWWKERKERRQQRLNDMLNGRVDSF